MHNYDTIFDNLDLLSAADGVRSRPAQNLATSLTWSLAGQVAGLIADLGILEHPDNPRRARSAEAAAERTQRLEQAIDERLVLLSQFAVRANPELLPDPERFLQRQVREPLADVDAAELSRLTGLDTSEVEGALHQERVSLREVEALRSAALVRDAQHVRQVLDQALREVRSPDEDVSPVLAARVLDKMAEKLDASMAKAVGTMARTLRPRVRAELAGQVRLMRSVLERLDTAISDMEARMEQRDEPGYPDRRREDDRRLYEEAA
jgi:hypothetical protein